MVYISHTDMQNHECMYSSSFDELTTLNLDENLYSIESSTFSSGLKAHVLEKNSNESALSSLDENSFDSSNSSCVQSAKPKEFYKKADTSSSNFLKQNNSVAISCKSKIQSSTSIFRTKKRYLPIVIENEDVQIKRLNETDNSAKGKNVLVPPLDEFAVRKLKNKNKHAQVEDAIMSCSKKIGIMTEKCSDLMDLKMKLAKKKLHENAVQIVDHTLPATSADEFVNILQEDWMSLSLKDQKELFAHFLDAMEQFQTIDE